MNHSDRAQSNEEKGNDDDEEEENQASQNIHGVIGILDIFGFEIFEHNSFEQFCINFANEKLQQHFNVHTFKKEEALYVSEGIDFTPTEFVDNQDVLNLVEKKPSGMLPMLDDEIRLPRGSDMSYLNKLAKKHRSNPRLYTKQPKDLKMLKEEFFVTHYADKVLYNVTGFCEKNRDLLQANLKELLQQGCDYDFVRGVLFVSEVEGVEGQVCFLLSRLGQAPAQHFHSTSLNATFPGKWRGYRIALWKHVAPRRG